MEKSHTTKHRKKNSPTKDDLQMETCGSTPHGSCGKTLDVLPDRDKIKSVIDQYLTQEPSDRFFRRIHMTHIRQNIDT
jgi:hypothetical protein